MALPLFCTLLIWVDFGFGLQVKKQMDMYIAYVVWCNIALVTCYGLQYWSASMNNIYEHIKMCIFCVLSFLKPTLMSWNCPEIF